MVQPASMEPIALVGLSLRLPGDANDLDGLWKLLESGKSAWSPVPKDRFNEEAFYHPNADDPHGTSNHPGGHFISSDVRDFDHAFFNFSKTQADATDPQQRLLMELAYEALESGGISRESIAGTATSVYTAIFPTDYGNHLYRDTLDLPTYYMTGVEPALFSNRLSHAFDLRGHSMTLDTACSGGLVAMHQACQSLRNGESEASLVAASNLILSPDHSIGLSNLHLLSSTGRCYPFDERGKGYGRGEGVVVLVLKRLADAIKSCDPVRAIIRSTAVGQDGFTPQNITYPNGRAQADLARAAYTRAGLKPENAAFVEAHGTGTKAGDKEELEGISEVFGGHRSAPLYVGSIKGAIGHTESVAGLASFLKATAMLERELIPPVAGFANPKSGLPLDRMTIPTHVVPLPQIVGATPCISVNSFGFGGANGHAIIERGLRHPREERFENCNSYRLFVLSASTKSSLEAMIRTQREWLVEHEEAALADLSYTLLHRRSALQYRFSAVAQDYASLLNVLSQGLGTYHGKPSPAAVNIVMVFTGQGAQWTGMGRELLRESSTYSAIFRDSILASRDMLKTLGADWDLEAELLYDDQRSQLNEPELAQPATTAIQIALVALLSTFGVRPSAVVGHSSGEIAAAYAAGRISQPTAVKIAFFRGAMAGAVRSKGLGPGAMLSVGLSDNDVAEYLEDLHRGKAMIACVNSPRSVTISGDGPAVDEVEERIIAADDGTFHRKLQVDTAYHSHHMRAVADDYLSCLDNLEVDDKHGSDGHKIAFISSVTGDIKASGFGAEYWVSNFVSPVRFSEAIQTLFKTCHPTGQHAACIEIGPHSALSGPVRQCLQQTDMPKIPFDYHSPLQRKLNAIASTLAFAGKIFELGVQTVWDAVSKLSPGSDNAVVRHDLPAYPWDHSTKHWYESRVARAYRQRKEPYHDLLGVPVLDSPDIEPRWRHFLSHKTNPWLTKFISDGETVFPAAGYVCMATEGLAQHVRQRSPQQLLETVALRHISFRGRLVIPDTKQVEVQMSMKPHQHNGLAFDYSIMALSEDSGQWHEYSSGIVEGVLANASPETTETNEDVIEPTSKSHRIHERTLHHRLDEYGNSHSISFPDPSLTTAEAATWRSLPPVTVQDTKASMPAQHQRPHIVHPVALDEIFHRPTQFTEQDRGLQSRKIKHIGELVIAYSTQLHEPGSRLDISIRTSFSQHRDTGADITVRASSDRVLTASDIKFDISSSSTAKLATSTNSSHTRETCYGLTWHNSIEYMRPEDLLTSPRSLGDFVTAVAFKCRALSAIGLGAKVDLSEEFLTSIGTNHKVTSYDFIDDTPGKFDDAAEHLHGFPVQYRMLRIGTDPVMHGFEAGACDVVLAASVKWLDQAAILVKPGGTVLLAVDDCKSNNDAVFQYFSRPSAPLAEQLSFYDEKHNRLVLVAKPSTTRHVAKTYLLTHSSYNTPVWVSSMENRLRSLNIEFLRGSLDSSQVKSLTSDDTVVIADDIPESPILSDTGAFDGAMTLIKQPSRMIWISPDDPAPFHQIKGVARTAHAEYDDLRLATIHAAPAIFSSDIGHTRLNDLVANTVCQVADVMTAHTEREYRLDKDGVVTVPRLHHSDKINHAITHDGDPEMETETKLFEDSESSLLLSPESCGHFSMSEEDFTTPLPDYEIEIAIKAFALPKSGASPTISEYAGLVADVGAKVTSVKSGDHVVALSNLVGASLLRVPHANAACFSSKVSFTQACAVLLNVMEALYALRTLARLFSSGGTILVHGAHTAAGRAAIAVARSIGVRVFATATDSSQARLLREQVSIDLSDVLIARRSVYGRRPCDIFEGGLDAIIQTSGDPLPEEVLPFVKPFRTVVNLGKESRAPTVPNLPANVALHSVDITGVLQARLDLMTTLIAESAAILEHVPLSGLRLNVRDVTDVAEALNQANNGDSGQIVLKVEPDSRVQVASVGQRDPWAGKNAVYVVAGGLGDIGQRLLMLMAQRGARHLATVSRRVVDSSVSWELRAKLDSIRPGIQLYLLQGDVTSKPSIEAAAASLSQQCAAPVKGVIQAAAFIKDSPLESTTYDEFTRVSDIKVNGTLNLHKTFASPQLAFFLSLSSVSSIIGTSAQASYNAGNAVQDALAHMNNNPSSKTRFFTVNFGLIEDAALTASSETRQNALKRAGFSLIGSQELERFLKYTLRAVMDPSTKSRQAIIGFDAESLAKATTHNGNIYSTMFSRVRDSRVASIPKDPPAQELSATSGPTFEQLAAEGNTEGAADLITSAMTTQLARLISVDASSINVREGSIMALGLDSLVAVELRNWVMRQFDAPLQSTDILEHQTVQALAEKITLRSRKMVRAAA